MVRPSPNSKPRRTPPKADFVHGPERECVCVSVSARQAQGRTHTFSLYGDLWVGGWESERVCGGCVGKKNEYMWAWPAEGGIAVSPASESTAVQLSLQLLHQQSLLCQNSVRDPLTNCEL